MDEIPPESFPAEWLPPPEFVSRLSKKQIEDTIINKLFNLDPQQMSRPRERMPKDDDQAAEGN
jgi:hypothetical protein